MCVIGWRYGSVAEGVLTKGKAQGLNPQYKSECVCGGGVDVCVIMRKMEQERGGGRVNDRESESVCGVCVCMCVCAHAHTYMCKREEGKKREKEK